MNPFISHVPLNPLQHEALIARHDLIDEVFSFISSGEYCLILGPKYSGRTTLLRAIKSRLQASPGELPIIVRPDDLDLTGDKRFFQSVAVFLEDALRNGKAWPSSHKSEMYKIAENVDAFNGFLNDLLGLLDRRVILLFDSIERIPPQILTRVANFAHSMFVEKSSKAFLKNISFNFAGAIDLRYLTLSQKPEVSPFNICRSIPLRDLSTMQARAFLERINETFDLGFRADVIAAILSAVGGDINMLQRVAGLSLDAGRRSGGVDETRVQRVVDTIARADSYHTEKSLLHTVRRTETDLPTLNIVLDLLDQNSETYRSAGIDAELHGRFQITYPEMTGALLLDRPQGIPTTWRFRNKLTEIFLRHHFTPQRIARTYLELGQHEEAVQSCDLLLDNTRKEFENNIILFNDSDLREILEVYTSRIYRIQPESSHEFAYTLLAKLLQRGFGCPSATYYEYIESQHKLSAANFLSPLFKNDGTEYDVQLPENQSIPEVQAFHTQLFVNENRDGVLRIAIPLKNQIGDVNALLTIHSTPEGNKWPNLELKVHVMQRAVQAINIALSNVGQNRNNHIVPFTRLIQHDEDPTRIDQNPPRVHEDPSRVHEGPSRVFVAHAFNEELLIDLRKHFAKIPNGFEFRYVDVTRPVGLLLDAIMTEIKGSHLCLYEISDPNNNVYFECGLGLGLNLPGILFLRINKSRAKASSPRIPRLFQGLARFNYVDYTGIIEDIHGRLGLVLREYLSNHSDPTFIHFLGCRVPKREKRKNYVAVLDHDEFGDQRDYRRTIDEIFEDRDVKPIYPLDSHVAIGRYLIEPHGGSTSSHLADVIDLLHNADIVICRVENVKNPHLSGQAFIGLGYLFGLLQTPSFGPLPVHMTLLNKYNRRAVGPPADLMDRRILSYSTYEELRTILKNVLPPT